MEVKILTNTNNEQQKYVEHEVQIRVLKETTESKFVLLQKNFEDRFSSFEKRIDDRFALMQKNLDDRFALFQKNTDDRFSHVDYKLNLLIGIAVVALLIPLIKSALGVI